jgi:hypothetical protein
LGGAIYLWSGEFHSASCLFARNEAVHGGALYLTSDSWADIWNATVAGNTATYTGSAVTSTADSLTVTNSIIWGNTLDEDGEGSQLYTEIEGAETSCTVTYCDLEGAADGKGNISKDPMFASFDENEENDDFTLTDGSPCIDAGFNSMDAGESDLPLNGRLAGQSIDMGAFETQ